MEMIEEDNIPQLNENCACCLSVPVSHLQFEIPVPLNGWQKVFEEMGIKVVTDPAGREAISTLAARKLLASRKRRDELEAEDHARRFAELDKKRPLLVGVPAVDGATPFESLVAAGGVVSPAEEFGPNRERPNFLREELEAGARELDEKKRLAADRAKERLAKQMRDQLR